MAKSIFGISASAQTPQESILNVAKRLSDIFNRLGTIDSIFLHPYYLAKNDTKKHKIDPMSVKGIQELAEIILKYNKGGIANYEKEFNPTIEYKRDFGFTGVFQFYVNEREQFSVFWNFGGSTGGGLGITSFNKEREFSFDWYYSVLRCLIDSINGTEGRVSISNKAFIDLLSPLKVKYPIGWITYFSNDLKVKIPDNLPGIEYEYTEKGKYLISTRTDFTSDKNFYFSHRDKLISIMKHLKKTVPGYASE